MTPLASWLVVLSIVFAAVALGLFAVYFAGKDDYDEHPRYLTCPECGRTIVDGHASNCPLTKERP